MDDGIRKYVLAVLRDEMNLPVPDDVDYQTPLGTGGLGLGSIVVLELSIRSEDEYDVDIINAYKGVLPQSLGEFVDRVERALRA